MEAIRKVEPISNISSDRSDLASWQTTSLRVELHYALLGDPNSVVVNSPVDGFLNIIFPDDTANCICPYFINLDTFLIRGGNNIIHTIKQNDVLEWKNNQSNSVAIAMFIPQELIIDLKFKFLQELDRFKKGMLTKSDNRIMLVVNQILDLHKRDNQLNTLRIQSLLLDAIVHQIEGLFAENEKHELITNKNHYDKIILAKNLIEKDLSKNYTIPELAKIVGTNEQYLKKYFKQHFGKTIMTYITERKMEHAKELIKTGNYRVADVARLTGYKHSTHFTTAFKKYFGFIPNSLRYTFLVANEGATQILTELETFISIL